MQLGIGGLLLGSLGADLLKTRNVCSRVALFLQCSNVGVEAFKLSVDLLQITLGRLVVRDRGFDCRQLRGDGFQLFLQLGVAGLQLCRLGSDLLKTLLLGCLLPRRPFLLFVLIGHLVFDELDTLFERLAIDRD